MEAVGIRTAALWACWMGKSSLLTKLLKIGADPNSADGAGRYEKIAVCCVIVLYYKKSEQIILTCQLCNYRTGNAVTHMIASKQAF